MIADAPMLDAPGVIAPAQMRGRSRGRDRSRSRARRSAAPYIAGTVLILSDGTPCEVIEQRGRLYCVPLGTESDR
jgi:hypothetical protein